MKNNYINEGMFRLVFFILTGEHYVYILTDAG